MIGRTKKNNRQATKLPKKAIKKYTEADMWEFALDYFEKFCKDFAKDGLVDVLKVDAYLSENIKKFGK